MKPLGPTGSAGQPIEAIAPSARVRALAPELSGAVLMVEARQSKAPPLAVGERVPAQVLEQLPYDRLRVQVKDGLLTLQLAAQQPGATRAGLTQARSGDTLMLEVASLAPRLTFVWVGENTASVAASVAVDFSEAALYTGELLRSAATLAGPAAATVLLADPLAPAKELAASLAGAVRHSGLFYESHLRAWAEGRMPLDRLNIEPQARAALGLKDASANVRDAASAELGGLLQRQLDVLDGRPMALSGFAWPGQRVDLSLQRDADQAHDDGPDDEPGADGRGDGTEPAPTWTTRLHLDLPGLGALGAQVRVVGSQVTLALTLGSDTGAALVASHRARLASALQAAGLTLTALTLETATASQPSAANVPGGPHAVLRVQP